MDTSTREDLQHHMLLLRDGDRRAFDTVYALVCPLVRRFAVRLLGNHEDAEDVAQTALLKVFEKVAVFDPEREALPWVLGITYHECRTWRKRRVRQLRRQAPESDCQELEALGPDPEEMMMTEELRVAMRDCLGALREQDMETLLAVAGELPRPAVPAATFRKRVQRATERLRAVWRQHYGH
jgi:RNA polymerase sigma-70 factor (ECF subfamily)